MASKNTTTTNLAYIELVKNISPKTKEKRSLLNAFLVGGFICVIGQFLRYMIGFIFNVEGDELSSAVSIVLIFFGAMLTGVGVYDRIGKYAGGGSIVPITGFANSVVAPAMEFRAEGFIYGLASKMFVISGPIIVFGVVSSVVIGFVYYFVGLF